MTVKVFSADFDSLVEEASQSPRARRHRNIYERYDDPCQQFMNAIGTDSYICLHRHSLNPKAEILRGVNLFLTFTYPHEIGEDAMALIEGAAVRINPYATFVVIENGMH